MFCSRKYLLLIFFLFFEGQPDGGRESPQRATLEADNPAGFPMIFRGEKHARQSVPVQSPAAFGRLEKREYQLPSPSFPRGRNPRHSRPGALPWPSLASLDGASTIALHEVADTFVSADCRLVRFLPQPAMLSSSGLPANGTAGRRPTPPSPRPRRSRNQVL